MSRRQVNNPALLPLRENLQQVILGKSECIDILLIALLTEGSVLIEDVPGVGKTTLAKALAQSLDARFHRIQFTPDLLPADILGSSIYNPVTGEFKFDPGPIFCNILLADEINRASPRTQSALLEAMNEQQATIEGTRHPLPRPFMVMATQNPVEFHGTYPLPEAQLDRFLVQLDMGYPSIQTEMEILTSRSHTDPLDALKPILPLSKIKDMQQQVKEVHIDGAILEYLAEVAHTTRHDNRLQLGISPRGTLMLSRSAQAAAWVQERDHVLPDDVLWLAPYVLPHRLLPTSHSRSQGITKQQIMDDILEHIKVPV
ncbi:AAA family ATPase [Planctomycetota bacterium]